MMIEELLILAVLVFVVYSLFQRGINKFIQPLRLRMVKIGDELLDDSSVPDSIKRSVEFNLDMAYSPWKLLLDIIFLPLATIIILSNRDVRVAMCDDFDSMPADVRIKYDLFRSMSSKSMYCANPLFTPLYLLELAVLVIGIMVFGRTERALSMIRTYLWRREDIFFGHHDNHAT